MLQYTCWERWVHNEPTGAQIPNGREDTVGVEEKGL
jgi:hypothetical protein